MLTSGTHHESSQDGLAHVMVDNRKLVIVNTNLSLDPDSWKDMLDNSKASAYEDRKERVCVIQPGSPIALYHVRVGIIAFGWTTDTFRRQAYRGVPDEEYFVPCEFETIVDPLTDPKKAISAREINAFLGAAETTLGLFQRTPHICSYRARIS